MSDADVRVAPVVVAIAADSCAACGVRLAADQRYCVECGHPRAAARLPGLVGVQEPGTATVDVAPPARSGAARLWASFGRSPNAIVFAGLGAVLLALGIGVLIGRSDPRSTTAAGSQRVTVVLSGSGAAVAAAPTPTGTTAAQGTTGASSAASTKTAKAAATTKPPAKTPPPKTVHVGSTGSGPGYQGGKFTGNFFGGGG